MKLHLYARQSEILVESLFLKIDKLEEELKDTQKKYRNESHALSMYKCFLVDEHPELTNEFASFILAETKQNYDGKCLASCGLEALDYHRDTLDSYVLEQVLAQLKEMEAGSKS